MQLGTSAVYYTQAKEADQPKLLKMAENGTLNWTSCQGKHWTVDTKLLVMLIFSWEPAL